MAVLTPPFLLGASGQTMSGRLARLSLGASFRPAASGVQVISGVLAGPANTQGELALPSPTQLTVQPFRAVVQSALDATAGPYEVINDAQVTLAVTAQNATQYRRSLVVVRVDDSQVSGVASSATTDRATLEVLDGALAATAVAATSPTPAGSWLALGEILIPPTGGTVTLTRYNPRTGIRHGILPVINDGATTTGHDGAPGLFDGQYRDHPVYGLERWDATNTRWASASPLGQWVDDVYSQTYSSALAAFANPPSMAARTVTVPPGRTLEVDLAVSAMNVAINTNASLGLYLWFGASATNPQDAAVWLTNGSTSFSGPVRLTGHLTNTGTTPATASFSVAGQVSGGAATIAAGTAALPNSGVVHLRHRVT